MEAKRLYAIPPVGEDRPADVVAKEVLALFRSEFKYNILDLTRLLCCQRDWVEDHILPEVLHIHLNRFFRDYVIAQADGLTDAEFETLSRGHYFFSERDLARYWAETARADRKTELIDLGRFLAPAHSRKDLARERRRHQVCLRQRGEKEIHREHMCELLTETGYERFLSGWQGRFEWVAVQTPDWFAVRGKLVSETIYRRKNGYTASSSAHVHLARSGSTRIKLDGRTLWLPSEPEAERDLFWPYPVQARAVHVRKPCGDRADAGESST